LKIAAALISSQRGTGHDFDFTDMTRGTGINPGGEFPLDLSSPRHG